MADNLCEISVEQLNTAVSSVVSAESSLSGEADGITPSKQAVKGSQKYPKAKRLQNVSKQKDKGSCLVREMPCIGIVNPDSGHLLLPIPKLHPSNGSTNTVSIGKKMEKADKVMFVKGNGPKVSSGTQSNLPPPPAYDSAHYTVTLTQNTPSSNELMPVTSSTVSTEAAKDDVVSEASHVDIHYSAIESASSFTNTTAGEDLALQYTCTSVTTPQQWSEGGCVTILTPDSCDKTDLGSGIAKQNSLMGLQNLVVTHLNQQQRKQTISNVSSTIPDVNEGNDAATTVIELLHVVEEEERPVSDQTGGTDMSTSTVIMSAYCIECNKVWPSGCPHHIHTYSHVPDSPMPTRARATLPSMVGLHSLDPLNSPNFTGIVARTPIAARTVFGPLEGKRSSKEELERPEDTAYVWELFPAGNKTCQVLDCRDEAFSNWLMFIKRARWSHEQNMVVYQHGDDIYFVTRCDIAAAEELLYWYSSDYAEMLGVASSPELLFPCPKCKKSFSNLQSLQRHDVRAHPDVTQRKHTCPQCNKAFSTASKLRQHNLTHSGQKPYPCSLCNKSFNVASNLKVHMRTHTNERKFHCDICDKSFVQKSQLTLHQVVHTGTKRFKCEFCAKVFARAGDRSLHENTHTNNHVYTCQKCNKCFYKLQNLRKHEKVHTGQKDFSCPHCEGKFSSRYHVKRHMKSCKHASTSVDS